jgi:hypothetical protein
MPMLIIVATLTTVLRLIQHMRPVSVSSVSVHMYTVL